MQNTEAKYTEQDLKRAFELGCTTMVETRAVGSPDFNTPVWVHNTNMQLFVWSEFSWERMRAWILDPRWGREENRTLFELITGRGPESNQCRSMFTSNRRFYGVYTVPSFEVEHPSQTNSTLGGHTRSFLKGQKDEPK